MKTRSIFLIISVISACKTNTPVTETKDVSVPVADSQITEGSEVDLICRSVNSVAEIDLRIKEGPRVEPSSVPPEVPAVFIEDLTENQFFIREFVVSGTAKQSRGTPHEETFDDRKMYGSLGFTEPGEGFRRLAIYGDYNAYLFRAISIEYNQFENSNRLQLYFAGNGHGATNFPLSCEGVMPDLPEARLPQRVVETYHREFTCDINRRGQIAATSFSFKVKNLHQPRIMQAVVQREDDDQNPIWVIGDIEQHQVSIFNEGDSGLGYRGTENNMTLELQGDSDGVVTASLSFDYPKRETTSVTGRFYYRPSGEGTLWSDVSCAVSAFDL